MTTTEVQLEPSTGALFAGDAELLTADLKDVPLRSGGGSSASSATEQSIKSSKIMIVDDEPYNIMIVRKHLKDVGYSQFITTTDPTEAIGMMGRQRPDLAILDVVMPGLNGLELLAAIRADARLNRIPVIILTASTDANTKLQALEAGATDFLAKPVDPSELSLRVRNTLVVKAHHDYLEEYSARLRREVRLRTAELEASRREAILCLARAAEYRDEQTGHHVIRVGLYAGVIARWLGMPEERVESLQVATQLHDVGKIGVSDTILLKPGQLDPGEFALMQKHCAFGQTIIQPLADKEWKVLKKHADMGKDIMDVCSSPVMRLAATIAQTHHERWDGTGYPQGLSGEDIPIEGRIAAVADVYDALSSSRPYKGPFPYDKCLAILEDGRGSQFDPAVLDAFLACKDDVFRIQREYADVV